MTTPPRTCTPFGSKEASQAADLIRMAFREDLDPGESAWGRHADATSLALIPETTCGQAALVSRITGVLAGVEVARMVFQTADPRLEFESQKKDGDFLQPGETIARIRGPIRGLLLGERTALNFLQRLSGIATWTASHVQRISDLPVVLLDTRKTTPGWRFLEKYAVRMGGATNHRMSLADGILVKDNHLAALDQKGLDQLATVLAEGPDIILLDNFSIQNLVLAVALRNQIAPLVLLEASGGIRLENLREVALTGIDRISVGGLIHQARSIDLALDYETS